MDDERISKLEKIMCKQDLTIESKAIYAYLCSYKKDFRNPTINEILCDLNISKSRFYKHMDALVEKGFVKRNQLKEKGLFSSVLYILT